MRVGHVRGKKGPHQIFGDSFRRTKCGATSRAAITILSKRLFISWGPLPMGQRRGEMREKRKASWLFFHVHVLGSSLLESYSLAGARATRCSVQCMLMENAVSSSRIWEGTFCMFGFCWMLGLRPELFRDALATRSRSQPIPISLSMQSYIINPPLALFTYSTATAV
jgi:hypothetical protein